MALENKLILRAVSSPFSGQFPGQVSDITKNSVLSWFELDNDLLYLKGQDIYTATTSGSVVTFHKLNGETLSFNSGGGATGGMTGGTVLITATTENGGQIAFSGENAGFLVDMKPMAGSGLTIDNSSGQYMLDLGSTLPTPSISSSWSWRKNDNTTPLGSSNTKNIKVPHGAYVDLTPTTFSYTLNSTDVQPTNISGDYGAVDPGPGNSSTPFNFTGLTANTTKHVIFLKPSSGLQVVGGSIQFATGNDTTSDSSSVTFANDWFIGYNTSQTPSATTIEAMVEGTLLNDTTSSFSKTGVDPGPGEYLIVAYPSSLGLLTNVIMNGAAPVLGAFTQSSSLLLTNSAGLSVNCYVYYSNAPDAYDNDDLEFIL